MSTSPPLLRSRNYLLLVGGRGISTLGDFFGATALSVIIYALTSSTVGLGITWAVFMIPRSVVRLFAGVYVDRWNRKRIMMITETIRGALFALLALAAISGLIAVWMVYLVSFLVGMFGALFDMANDSLLPSLVEKAQLVRANSDLTGVIQAGTVAGWALAGITIGEYGSGLALVVDSASFFALVIFLRLIRAAQDSRDRKNAVHGSWTEEFKEGAGFFRSHRELVWLSFFFAVVNFLLSPLWYVYLLPFSVNVVRVGVAGYGYLNAIETLGLVIASVTMSYIGHTKRKRGFIIASMTSTGLCVAGLALTHDFVSSSIVMLVTGFTIPFANVVTAAYYQEVVPFELRGRVFGVRYFIAFFTIPIGILFGGFVSATYPLVPLMIASGLALAAFSAFNLLVPSARLIDEARPAQSAPSTRNPPIPAGS